MLVREVDAKRLNAKRLNAKQADDPASAAGSELLIKEAREHRVRRWKRRGALLLAILAAGAAAGAAVDLAGTPPATTHRGADRSARPPIHHAPLGSFTIVQPGGTGTATAGPAPTTVVALDPGTGTATTRSLPVETNIHYPWIARGHDVVAVEGTRAGGNDAPLIGTAYAFDPTSTAAPLALGPASSAMAGSRANAVWLFTSSLTENQVFRTTTKGDRCTLEEVAVTGSVLRPRSPFPCGLDVAGEAPQGFLTRVSTTVPGTWRYEIWSLRRHRIVRRLSTVTATPTAVQHNGTTLAWATSGRSTCVRQSPCALHFTDLETGHVVTWHVPAHRAVDAWTLEPGAGSDVAVVLVRPRPYLHYLAETSFAITDVPQPVHARLLVLSGASGSVLSSRPIATTFAADLYLTPGGSYALVAARVTPTSTTGDWAAYPSWSSSAPSHTVQVTYDTARGIVLGR